MKPLDIVRADAEWSALYDRLRDTLLEGVGIPGEDPGLPVGDAPVTVIEKLARALADHSSPVVSLAMTFPLCLVTASVACQGAIFARTPKPGGSYLKIPAILQATVIAPSGYGKSNALVPLVEMIGELNGEAAGERRALVARWVDGLEPGEDAARWKKVLQYGWSDRLTLDSGTPEGMRSALLRGGGVAGVMTAEPDVLREINGYAKDGGTFRWLLDGWNADQIGVVRAEREMVVPRACLPYIIMVQPNAFDEFNQSRAAAAGGRADAAISRGLYGRSFLVRITKWAEAVTGYGLDEGVAGAGPGYLGPVAGAEAAFRKMARGLFLRTNDYRARMGVVIGWGEEKDKPETGERPVLPVPLWLGLAGDGALWVYNMLQNVRLALYNEVGRRLAVDEEGGGEGGSGLPGMSEVLMPMVSRLTQQAVRLAMLLALSEDPGCVVIPRWALLDACFRLLPWLLDHWAQEMYAYKAASMEYALESDLKGNVAGQVLTYGGQMRKTIAEWGERYGEATPFARGEVVTLAYNKLSRAMRRDARVVLNREFDALVAVGELEMVPGTGMGGGPKAGIKFVRSPKWHD